MTGWPATFEAINMAVIPKTDQVIVWDSNGANGPIDGPWLQRFAVGNPETGVFTNKVLILPAGFGDLFCSGQTWLPNGKLFVAGGNTSYPQGGVGSFRGSRFVGIWDFADINGPTGGWDLSFITGPNPKPMLKKRWYPTVTLISATKVMVSGGSEDTALTFCAQTNNNDGAFNTYEVFDLNAMDWERDGNNDQMLYQGPVHSYGPCTTVLGQYPRMHSLSTNQAFLSGQFQGTNRVRHTPWNPTTLGVQTWMIQGSITPIFSGSYREDGSSVLLPNVGNTLGASDLIMILGGGFKTYTGGVLVTQGVLGTSRIIDGILATPQWQPTPEVMNLGRMVQNSVLLPNGEVAVFGGSSDFYFETELEPNPARTPVLDVEIYNKRFGWRLDAAQSSPRMYHSTAGLLLSGNPVSAGGDIRTSDYEVYIPSYFTNNQAVPQFAGTFGSTPNPALFFGTQIIIDHDPLPVGVSISRVVLMSPCAVTHHSDMHQRYIELRPTPGGGGAVPGASVGVLMPNPPNYFGTAPGSVEAIHGWHMMFLITSQETPSQGKWVELR